MGEERKIACFVGTVVITISSHIQMRIAFSAKYVKDVTIRFL
jgi:hypothetical protein